MFAILSRAKDPTKEYKAMLNNLGGKKSTKVSFEDGAAVAAALSQLGGKYE